MKEGKNQQVVLRLIDAISDNDKERIQSFFSDDSVFHHLSDQPTIGGDAIWNVMSDVHNDAEQVDWQIDAIHENEEGDVVTKGCVRYLIEGTWREYEVNGAFEVRGSKITQWH